MNNKFSLSLVCSALLITGCGDNSESSGSIYSDAIEQSLERSSKVSFTLLGPEADIPLPSFFLFDTNDHTLNIPLDANSTGLLNDPKVAMGEADGWSTIMPFTINVNLPSDRTLKNDVVMMGTTPFSSHLNAGVKVAKVDVDLSTGVMSNFTALTAGVDYLVVSSDFKTINILPLKGLDPSSDYIYALTDSIVDSEDEPLGTSSSYASLKTTDIDQAGSLDLPQKIIHQVEALFAGYGSVSSSDEIIYSSWFTTASAGNVMNGTKAAIAQTISPAVSPSDIWKNLANPNNISVADLDKLYTFTVDGTKQDFATAVQADTMFKGAFGEDAATQLAAGYNATFSAPTSIQVYKGTVELPYFLSDSLTDDEWKTTPWRSAMPSVLTILNVLSLGSDADKTAIATQLAGLGITEPATQLYQAEYQQLLIGEKLTLASGEQLDSARVMTKYSAVPQIRAAKSVPFVMFVPEGAAIDSSLPILQYQHGITSIKESAYAFAMQHIGGALTGSAPYKPYAIIAIDQPLHGQRALSTDVVTTPTTPTVYMNLEYLPVARDNIRQSAIDGLGVRFALNSATDSAFGNLDKTNVSLFGHSIGAITGISSYTVGNTELNSAIDSMFSYTSATLANPGGGIAPFLLNSDSFSPEIKHTVSLSSVTEYQAHYTSNCAPVSKSGGVCFAEYYTALSSASASDEAIKATIDSTLTSFTYAAQTVLDNVDPYNIASTTTGPILGIQADGDGTIPNSVADVPTAGTEPLFEKLSLVNTALDASGTRVASYFDSNSSAGHSTVISPSSSGVDVAANTEMTSQIVQFTLTQGNATETLAVDDTLLDASKNVQ
ncbi:VolA/Pla-1 family phospholipase [Vibrio coralliirubri]|uniref:VolA/Pla-1 family phospholipase n=1 Tax=Vibrio coralliirubri TaxID=1516159 RepID=UPI0006331A49|nr:VolA/Pla-1 family phospholipase [Vibrio coralliirubri]CDT37416.1 Hydrolases of the alpha/beta superfamily [Vibrio coralliirubri]CDT86150.1 Hydrolases of the alpha/beta superfamily [Vibrio coralliirubri]CDT91469.1 Hydrolases of the alpha/beta superfamily [Vibrio coralliirubri]